MSDRVARARAVRGWMSPAELSWLETAASGVSLAIELGSWRGRSSVALTAAKSLVCVDTFIDQSQETGTGEDLLPSFMDAVSPYVSTVTAIRGDIGDEEFCESLLNKYREKADLVFIDASHDEQSVRRDIGLAKKLCAKNGVICGHDFSIAWPGVVAAVRDLVPGFSVAAESIWWCRA